MKGSIARVAPGEDFPGCLRRKMPDRSGNRRLPVTAEPVASRTQLERVCRSGPALTSLQSQR